MRREETTEEGMRGTTEEERREEETTGTTEEATDMMTGTTEEETTGTTEEETTGTTEEETTETTEEATDMTTGTTEEATDMMTETTEEETTETTEEETTETTEEETTEMTEEVTEDTAAEAAATPVTRDIKCTLFVTQFFMPSFFQSLKDTKRRYTQKLRVATGSSFRRRLIHRSYGSAFRSEFSRSAPEVRTNRKASQRANGVLPPFHENNRKDVIESTEGVTRVLHLCEHTAAVRGRGSLAIQAVCDGFERPLREAA